MNELRLKIDKKKVDTKEFELPETVFIRDIENKVFQGIVLQVLSKIEGISLIEGSFIDSLLGRQGESVKGIYAEQKTDTHTIHIRVEVNICYGIPIPEKAEEIQTKIADEVTKLTGLHVSSVHVIFKNIISEERHKQLITQLTDYAPVSTKQQDEYTDEF